MSIHDLADKIKGRVGIDHIKLISILIIFLVGISAFGLGRLSVDQSIPKDSSMVLGASESVSNNSNTFSKNIYTNSNPINNTRAGKYVASKNGKLYYTLNCAGVKRIKEENKVYFDSASDAEKLGLTKASSCK